MQFNTNEQINRTALDWEMFLIHLWQRAFPRFYTELLEKKKKTNVSIEKLQQAKKKKKKSFSKKENM